jgi:cellulose synthase/poly-beta-1,6-N-acetylglucosamine synthase-like glycosyltransferase
MNFNAQSYLRCQGKQFCSLNIIDDFPLHYPFDTFYRNEYLQVTFLCKEQRARCKLNRSFRILFNFTIIWLSFFILFSFTTKIVAHPKKYKYHFYNENMIRLSFRVIFSAKLKFIIRNVNLICFKKKHGIENDSQHNLCTTKQTQLGSNCA